MENHFDKGVCSVSDIMPEVINTMGDRAATTGSGSRIVDARETFSTLAEISRLLNTGLDTETLAICVRLCEQGANPEALAIIIRELRRESSAIKQNSE